MDYLIPLSVVSVVVIEMCGGLWNEEEQQKDAKTMAQHHNVGDHSYAKNAYVDFQHVFGSRNFNGPQLGPVREYNDGLYEMDVHASGSGVPAKSWVSGLL